MKKYIFIIASLLCITALGGCKKTEEQPKPSPTASAEVKETAEATEPTAETESAESTTTPEATAETPAEAPAETAPEAAEQTMEYKPGTVNGSVFESEFLGMRFTATDGWTFLSEQEKNALPSDSGVTWEYAAFNTSKGSSIMVSSVTRPGTLNEEALKAYITGVVQGNENSLSQSEGITIVDKITDGTCTIAGKTYTVSTLKADVKGTPLTMNTYARIVNDSYISSISISYNETLVTNPDEIINMFTAY